MKPNTGAGMFAARQIINQAAKTSKRIEANGSFGAHHAPYLRFYRKPIVTSHHARILPAYPAAMAGTHFKCEIKV